MSQRQSIETLINTTLLKDKKHSCTTVEARIQRATTTRRENKPLIQNINTYQQQSPFPGIYMAPPSRMHALHSTPYKSLSPNRPP